MRVLTLMAAILATGLASSSTGVHRLEARSPQSFGVPSFFVRNAGRFDSRVRYYAGGGTRALFATDEGVTFAGGPAGALALRFADPADHVAVEPAGQMAGRVNDLHGQNAEKWQTNIPIFPGILYRQVWHGIDVRMTLDTHTLKYQFELQAGADPAAIRLRYDGASQLSTDEHGHLHIRTSRAELVDRAPQAFQMIDGGRVPIASAFDIVGRDEYRFVVAAYDRTKPLVIDPTVEYASYLGSSGADVGRAIAVDSAGYTYVAGFTQYIDFPATPGALQTTLGGNDPNNPKRDAFVAKISPDGSRLMYATYLGGSSDDEAFGIAVDAGGNAYLTGYAGSSDFPTTPGAVQQTSSITSAFIAKLNATGSALVYSTFYGTASGTSTGSGIAVDAAGRAYVAGDTNGNSLPGTATGFQPSYAGQFRDGFLVRLNASGTAVDYATYIGGTDYEFGTGVAVRGTDAFVVGQTWSHDFPTTTGAFDATGVTPILESTDGAATWDYVHGIRMKSAVSFAQDPTIESVIYAGTLGQGVFKSTDGGATFSFAGTGIPQRVQPNSEQVLVSAMAVSRSNPDVVYAATSVGLYKTTDGGSSWTLTGFGGVRLTQVAIAADAATVFVCGGGGSGGVSKSTDGGATWVSVATFGSSLAVDPLAAGTVYVGDLQGQAVHKTVNGGATWSSVPLVGTRNIRVASNGVIYAPTDKGVFRSSDRASSFTKLAGFAVLDTGYTDVAIDSSTSPPTLYALKYSGYPGDSQNLRDPQSIFKSTDGGATAVSIDVRGSKLVTNTITSLRNSRLLLGVARRADAFVVRVATSAVGAASLVYGSYLSGGDTDVAKAIAVDESANAYVAGYSVSGDFPITAGAVRAAATAGWIAKLNDLGGSVIYAARPPSDGLGFFALAIDGAHNAYLGGDGTITQVTADGSAATAARLGGFPPPTVNAVAAVSAGVAVATGKTTATDFPTTPGVFQPVYGSGESDAFVVKINFADGSGGGGSLPSPWISQDIGTTGVTGSATFDNGVFAVKGAGADIWGAEDSFQFVFQPLHGDGTIIARVTGEQETDTFAKAGIMLRNSLSRSAQHVLLDIRPGGGVELMQRVSSSGETTFLHGGSMPFRAWLKLERRGDTVTGFTSSDGAAWSSIGSAQFQTFQDIDVGLAVTSHDVGNTNTATFDNVSVTTGTGGGGGLPAPWQSHDVGSTGQAGAATFVNGAFIVKGAGNDIWDSSDAFQYVSQPVTGDVQVVARVASLQQDSDAFAKAGVMLRQSIAPDSAHVILDIRPDGSLEFMTRPTSGGATSFIKGGSLPFPAWLKLVRSADTVTAFVSTDGSSWNRLDAVTTSIAASATVGLAVTSHDAGRLTSATFDNVAVTAGSPPSAHDVVIYAGDVPSAARHGSWTTASDASSPNGVKLVTPDAGVANTNNPLDAPVDYVDVSFNADAGVPYTMWLRLQASSSSKSNDSVWVQFSDAQSNGAPVFGIGTTDGLLVNLATDSTASSLSGWGWQNTAYWLSQVTTVTFAAGGSHTLRIQVREDGVQLDQIVLSRGPFLNSPPGPATNDTTIVPKP